MTVYENVLNALSARIDDAARKSYKRFLKMVEAGVTPQEALQTIYLSFKTDSFNYIVAALTARAFTELLKTPFTPIQILELKVGNVKLSTRLYQHSESVAKEVMNILTQNQQVFSDLRKLSLDLYSGYNQKSVEVLRIKDVLPKYLKRAYEPFASQFDREAAKLLAQNLRTDALRAGYMKVLDKLEQGASKKAVSKAIEGALHEKARYLAHRLVTNETSIAYNKAQAKKIISREDVEVVEIRPSGSHTPDICDSILNVDHYGLGKGRYPKALAPRPPFHHFCRCNARSIINTELPKNVTRREDAAREWLDRLPEDEQLVVAGSKANLARLQNGESISNILNRGHNADYRIKNLAEGDLEI